MKKAFGLIIILLTIGHSCRQTKSSADSQTSSRGAYGDLYNKNKQITRTGYFKDNKLWDGKSYTYDSTGVLTKISIHKDGQIVRDSIISK